MNKKLAIKGHASRGKEVIEILEMLGGKNYFHMDGFTEKYIYYICGGKDNQIHSVICPTNQIVFTIEEFLEKYPYKVGDKVDFIKYGDEDNVYEIVGMIWTGTTIEYTLDSFGFTCLTKDIRLHKENNMNKKFKSLDVETYLKVWDETENGLEVHVAEGYEMIEKNGQFYIVKQKTKYPKTYNECCKVLDCKSDNFYTDFSCDGLDVEISEYEYIVDDLLQYFRKLIYCRDAYWAIIGEQMGLGKPWEPDWNDEVNTYYTIHYNGTDIKLYNYTDVYSKLAFPTVEMRDAFYENFKNLIGTCKELL